MDENQRQRQKSYEKPEKAALSKEPQQDWKLTFYEIG
jgi:hypothetical protein